MKQLFKHSAQTLLLIAMVWLVVFLSGISWIGSLNTIVWGLIAVVLILTGIYLYWGHKRGLFILMVGMILCLSTPVWAYQEVHCDFENAVNLTKSDVEKNCLVQNKKDCEYHACVVEGYAADYCAKKDEFDVDEYIKEDKKPDEYYVRRAANYLDAYDRAAAAGCVEKHGWFTETITLGLISGDDEDARDCAKGFLEKVAEYEKKKAELNTQTVYQILQIDENKCWPCGIIHIMMVVIEKLSLRMEDELSQAAMMLLVIMFLFWLLVKVLMLIGQFGTANNAEFFTDLLTRFILAVIAFALLNGPMGFIYRMTFSNLLNVTMALSSEVVQVADSDTPLTADGEFHEINVDSNLSNINNYHGAGSQLVNNQNLGCECCTNPNKDCNNGELSSCRVQYTGTKAEGLSSLANLYANGDDGNQEQIETEFSSLFSKKDKQILLCLTCKAYKETAPFVAAGRVLVYHAWKNKTLLTKAMGKAEDYLGVHVVSWVPSPVNMWFVGMTLIICFSWISYVLAFKVLDVFLRIGFIIILTPFLVTAFVFPISRQYTKRGWDFLVHALLSIFAVFIGIALFMALPRNALPDSLLTKLRSLFTITSVLDDETSAIRSDVARLPAWVYTSTGRTPPGSSDGSLDAQGYAEALMGAISGSAGGSAFYALFFILIICFAGIKVLQASQVIIEGLSGLTCGIPSVAGVAVVGAIRAALAPFRMIKNVIMDRLDSNPLHVWKRAQKEDEKQQENEENPDQLGFISKTGAVFGERIESAGDKAGQAAGRATEKFAQARGKAAQGLGRGMIKVGRAAGKIPVVGWVLAPVIVAAGAGMQAAGHIDEKTAKIQGKVVEKVVKAGSRAVAKGIKKGSKGAQKIWNKFKRNVINRIKQLPAKIKNIPKNIKKKFLKSTRRMRARQKYRHQKDTGHGPANWKPSERSGGPKPKPKPRDKDKDRKPSGNSATQPKESFDHKVLRKTMDVVDRADEKLDEGLDAAEKSFGNDGNRVLPDTKSE